MTTDEIMRLADNFANLHRHSTDRASNVARKDLRTAVEQLAASQGEQAKVPLSDEAIAHYYQNSSDSFDFARAIEAAHGIGVKEQTV